MDKQFKAAQTLQKMIVDFEVDVENLCPEVSMISEIFVKNTTSIFLQNIFRIYQRTSDGLVGLNFELKVSKSID